MVLGLGGYVAFPGGMMASLLNRPLALHEQNAIAGLANRVLAQVSDKVMVAFPEALKGAEWTGNPVRSEIAAIAPPEVRFARQSRAAANPDRRRKPRRAGAERSAAESALSAAGETPRGAPGGREAHRGAEEELRRCAVCEGELVAFIDDMARRYAEADLVICRAGAVTIAELSAGGMASILVPFPHAVDDHQTANAQFLADRGAAILIQQRDLSPEKLAALIRLARPSQAARHGAEGARARKAGCRAPRRASAAWSIAR